MKIEMWDTGLDVSERDALNRLAMIVHDGAEPSAVLSATNAGFLLDDSHAMVSIDYLRNSAQPAGPNRQDWNASFEKMIEFADSKGWVNDGMVRVHVEHSD
jgi:hypothetical protein